MKRLVNVGAFYFVIIRFHPTTLHNNNKKHLHNIQVFSNKNLNQSIAIILIFFSQKGLAQLVRVAM